MEGELFADFSAWRQTTGSVPTAQTLESFTDKHKPQKGI